MLLTLNRVARFFGSRLIFKDVSFALAPGNIVLLAGPNGAGKTTLLKIMAGLIPPSEGTVTAGETKTGAGASVPARLGYLGHQTFLYPELTALENLAFWAGLHKAAPRGRQLMDALERVDLAAFAEEKAGGFSRGMAQRLNLARVFLLRPDILLLDEPGTGLDARSLNMLRREVARARETGAGVVWITHTPEEDSALADGVAVLEKKTLTLFADPGDWLRRTNPPPEPPEPRNQAVQP